MKLKISEVEVMNGDCGKNEDMNEDMSNLPYETVKKAKKMGANDVVCSLYKLERYQIRFSNNLPTTSNYNTNYEIWVFLAKDGKTTSFKLSELSKLEDMLERGMKELEVISTNKDYAGIAKGPFKYKERKYDEKIAELGEKSVELVESAIEGALAEGAERTAGVLYTNKIEKWHATSGDVNAYSKGAYVEISLRAFIGKDASGHATASSTTLAKFKPDLVGKSAGEIAKIAKEPRNAECGKMDVLFYPLAFAGLLNEVASAASAFNVDAGFSFLKDRLGKKVASEKFTLYDDGILEEGIFSSPFDDEGYPTRRNAIIEKGVVKSYLHNTSTAKKWNTERTGNAGLMRPHPWNLVMDKGDFSRDEMTKGMDKGLIVTNIWYTRYQDYESGDFSTIPRDGIFFVKNGKIEYAVKGIRISDNLPRMLSSIEKIGKKEEQIHWWEVDIPTFCSDVLVKDVRITKSTE